MVSSRSYIGDKYAGGFQWDDISDEKYRIGNLPRRIVPANWFENLGIGVVWFSGQIRNGIIVGKQIDWGAYGAEMTGEEILHFWDTAMRPKPTNSSTLDEARMESWQSTRLLLETLVPNAHYILTVAKEA